MSGKNVFWIIVIFLAAFIGAFMGPSLLGDMSVGVIGLLMVVVFGGIIVLIVWSLSGNRGGRAASSEELSDARAMRPAEGKGRIYVIRRGFVAALQGMNVDIEGVASGQIKSKQFLMVEVDPGTYRLNAKMARGGKSTRSEMDLEVRSGEPVVIQAFVEMGALAASTKLEPVEAGVAKAQLAEMKMVHWAEA